MKKILASLLIIVMVTTSCAVTLAQIPSNEVTVNDFEWEVLRLVNIERAKAGLDSLALLEPMQKAAGVRENELKTLFSHTRPDGSGCETVVPQDFSYNAFGENIAQGQKSPKQVMKDWMNSEGHRANILSKKYGYMGVGFSENNWVQLFADRKEISSCAVSSPTTEFKNEKALADEYLICETVDGYTSYLPLDINSMTQSQGNLTPMLPTNDLPVFTIGNSGSSGNISNPLNIELPTPKGDEKYQNSDNVFNVTANQAVSMLSNARSGKSSEPFLLLYYSRYCNICAGMVPTIIKTTEKNNLQLYMLDNGNTYNDGTPSSVLNYHSNPSGGSVPFPVIFYYDGNTTVSQELAKPNPLPENYKNFLIDNDIITDDGNEPGPTPKPTPKPTSKPTPKPTPTAGPIYTGKPGINITKVDGEYEENEKGMYIGIPLGGCVVVNAESDQPIRWNGLNCGNIVVAGSTADGTSLSLQGTKPGTVTVSGKTKDGKHTKILTVTVSNTPEKQKPGVLPKSVFVLYPCYLRAGYDYKPDGFTTYPSNADRSGIKFESSDTEIATVDNNGVVHAKKNGTAEIFYTFSTPSFSDIKGSTPIIVSDKGFLPPAEQDPEAPIVMMLNKDKLTLVIGDYNLDSLWAEFSNGKNIPYSFVSSDPSIVKVVGDMSLVALKPGKVTITATSKNIVQSQHLTATSEVTVVEKAPKPTAKPTATPGPTATSKPGEKYLDGSSDWAKNEIKLAKEAGLTLDSVLNNYQQNITRAEFCKLAVNFYKAMGGELPTVSESPFTDTSDHDILVANKLGIVNGVSETEFSPNSDTTREEISAMMMRAIKNFDTPEITNDLTRYEDYNQISPWAIESMTYLNQEGIIKGMSDTIIAPLENTSREQAILIVYRTLNSFKFDAEISNGTYKIMTAVNAGNCIGIGGGSKDDGANAITWESVNIDDQKFELEKVGDKYSLIAVHSGKALTPNGAQKNGTEIVQKAYSGDASQLFDVVETADGYISFVSSDGYYLSVSGGSTQKGTKIILWQNTGNSSQKFKLENA
ncbi:MAG: RICIN domain-containing protein [Oscillospiraceae bacterium]